MKRTILLALAAVVCLVLQAQKPSKNNGAQDAISYSYHLSGGMMRYMSRDGREVRQGMEISIAQKNGEWYVSGYQNEDEQSVKVSPKVAKRVKKMLKKIKWTDLHPQPVDGMIKVEVSDGRMWRVRAHLSEGKNILESGTELEGYAEPKKLKKAYDKVIRQIDEINDYLMGFLTIEWKLLRKVKK